MNNPSMVERGSTPYSSQNTKKEEGKMQQILRWLGFRRPTYVAPTRVIEVSRSQQSAVHIDDLLRSLGCEG
ncbi:hypothetical protein SAMN00790413_04047 [Deinococcus hopiensis KR-140]|uniref:Uncharacterized protein n=1 Tax=Deinococcus hopiensis KR-140 TaxID=695939 RepID=A0A1W1UNX3_9DEIO|nr:hypothetical protein SAMN00790413_04047 [Deinococcus hopiensis KR-140]